MVAKSYNGETTKAECQECGNIAEIPAREFQEANRDPWTGYCTAEECERLVNWEERNV